MQWLHANFPSKAEFFFSLSYKWKYITESLLTALRASGQMKPEILNLFSKICQKVDAQFSSLYTTGRPSLNQLRRPPSMWTIVLYPSNDSRYAAINDLLPTPLIQSNHHPSSGMQTFTGLNWTKWVMWKPHLDCWPSERLAVGFTVPPDWQATIVLVLLSSLEFTSVKIKTHQMSEDTLLCCIPPSVPGWLRLLCCMIASTTNTGDFSRSLHFYINTNSVLMCAQLHAVTS